MARLVLPSTTDNPYDPHTDWDHWLAYDREMGYGTYELLARVMQCADPDSDEEYDAAFEEACDMMIKWDETGKRCKKIYEVDDENIVSDTE